MKTLLITNIASPYRVDFFRYLQETYPAYGFSILYTSDRQEGREWGTDQDSIRDSVFLHSKAITVGKKGWERTIYFPPNPKKVLDDLAPDVVVASEYNPAALSALSWCKKHGVPFVHWTDGTLVNERNLNFVQKWSRKRIVKNADSFIASSSAAKKKLEVYGAKRKIFVSSLTVDIKKYLTKKEKSGQKTLLTVGGLIERKGIDLLLHALSLKPDEYRLWVVGNGAERENLEALAREKGIDTTFFGFLEGEALRKVYAEADAFVLPTREDCFGLVLLEAMCASLPIVCSTYADGGYDLIDGNGTMADPFDPQAFLKAIEETVAANGTDNVLGRRSYERAQLFAFEKVAPPFVQAVDKAKKKRVLLVDNASDGHHVAYAKTLFSIEETENTLVFPEGIEGAIPLPKAKLSGLHPLSYLQFVRRVKKIAKEEKVDIVHFLDGNPLVNYWGVGLSWLKRYRGVITYHLHFRGKWKDFGHKRLAKLAVSVVHTEKLKNTFETLYGGEVRHIEYPDFLRREVSPKQKTDETVLLALGQTRYEKGLDLLLEALNAVQGNFRLIVAGAPDAFDEAFIREKSKAYAEKVTILLRYLSEEEVHSFLQQCDVVVLPYRNAFEGASGPLTEGVGYGKCIVGPKGGSVGELIQTHHLGITFEGEDVSSLQSAIERAMTEPFSYDERAEAYRAFLSPKRFRQEYADLYQSL